MTAAADHRTRFPEIAALVDGLRALGYTPRVTCITDHDGNVLLGKMPEPDPRTYEVSVEHWEAMHAHRRFLAEQDGRARR